MDKTLINNWNSTVTEKDLIFHLGDLAFCNADERRQLMRKLKGNKILIKGNHDSATDTHYKKLGFIEVYERLEFGNYILSHKPIETDKINIHGHKHNNQLDSDNHYCVSVEQINYKPILLNKLIRERGLI